MPETNNQDSDVARQIASKIRSISPEFAKAAEHIGCAMRGSYLKLQAAINDVDIPTIGEIINRMHNSELVKGAASKLHDIREEINKIWEVVEPFAGVASGVIVALFGFGIGGAIAPVLIIGGFIFAALSALSLGAKQMKKLTAN
jgi:hypothetical protein